MKSPRSSLRRGRARPGAPRLETSDATPVEKLLAMGAAVVHILAAMLFMPHRLDEKINGATGIERSLPKFSFLTVCIFSAVKACKYLLMLFILANLVWMRGCDPVTQQALDMPDVTQHLNIPSLQDILLIGLPSALLILGLLVMLRALLRLAMPVEAARRFFNVAVYIAGFEYLVVALALAGSLPFHTRANRNSLLELVPFFSFGVVLVWGALLMAITAMRASRVPGKPRRWHVSGPMGIGAFLLMLVWNGAIVGTVPLLAFPLAANAIKPELEKPVLTVALLHASATPGQAPRYTVALSNLGREHRYLLHTDLAVLFDALKRPLASCQEGRMLSGRVAEWSNSTAAGTMLAPGEVVQLNIDLLPAVQRDCEFPPWRVPQSDEEGGLRELLSSGVWDYPVPQHYHARLAFDAVNVQTGVRRKLVAFLLAEPGRAPAN
ncbi:hypothetical protein [Pseudoduganella sp. HUAS MS19]